MDKLQVHHFGSRARKLWRDQPQIPHEISRGILQKQKESAMEWTSTLLFLSYRQQIATMQMDWAARPDLMGMAHSEVHLTSSKSNTWTSESLGPRKLHSGSRFHEQRSPALGACKEFITHEHKRRKDIALQGHHILFHASALLSGPPAGRHWQHWWNKCM